MPVKAAVSPVAIPPGENEMGFGLGNGYVFTNDNCIGCNKCVRICAAVGASISKILFGKPVISIDTNRCINCGACFEACDRDARDYHDDTERFFRDIDLGREISLLVAPSFMAKYPDKYREILGGFKALGIKRIIPVAFGADVCTWAYLQVIQNEGPANRISTSCPVVTAFVEHCLPQLIPYLMPVMSPLLCAATYCREELGMKERFAFIGPCIAKKSEAEQRPDLVRYNVTMERMMKYVEERQIYGEPVEPEIPAGLGTFYPAPGGLADNIKWFLGDDTPIRTISGKRYLFRWLRNSTDRFLKKEDPYCLIDALNCQEGCIEGSMGKSSRETDEDNAGLLELTRIRAKSKSSDPDSPWNPALSPERRLELFNKQFENLSLSSYLCEFEDKSEYHAVRPITPEQRDEIFFSMYKVTEADRNVNCSACGYPTCEAMVLAVYNDFNTIENCIYYQREEALRNERRSYYDQLTGALNRNAFEDQLPNVLAIGQPLSIVVADVNGLKAANDKEGHEAGDRLIQNCANLLKSTYGESRVYRTGGDEFVAVRQGLPEAETQASIDFMKKKMEGASFSMALGYAHTEDYEGRLRELQNIADARMYEDKDRYYEATGKKRRK